MKKNKLFSFKSDWIIIPIILCIILFIDWKSISWNSIESIKSHLISKDILEFLVSGGLISYLISKYVVQEPIISKLQLKNNISSLNKNDATKS